MGAQYRTLSPVYLPGDRYVEAGKLIGEDTPFSLEDDFQPHDGLEGTNEEGKQAIKKASDRLGKVDPLMSFGAGGDASPKPDENGLVPQKPDDGDASAAGSDPVLQTGIRVKPTLGKSPDAEPANKDKPQPFGTNFGGGAGLPNGPQTADGKPLEPMTQNSDPVPPSTNPTSDPRSASPAKPLPLFPTKPDGA